MNLDPILLTFASPNPLQFVSPGNYACHHSYLLGGFMDKVHIRPGVGMYSLFPHMNYKPWFTLGEMVDNSIQSYFSNRDALRKIHGPSYRLQIDISFSQGSNPMIVVEDNAGGISEADAVRAFTPAAPPTDKTGISQFGIGMKSSATWYSHFYVISSSALGEKISRTVTFDIEKIIAEEIEDLDIVTESKDPNSHGTRIVMSKLHQGIPTGATLGKIRSYLSSIYREFIKSGEIVMTVGDEKLNYFSPELLQAKFWDKQGEDKNSPVKTWQIPIDFMLSESWEKDISPNKPTNAPRIRGWIGILKEGSTKYSGAALIWKKKVVVGAGSLAQGDEDSYRPNSIFGASTTFPFQRLIGEIDVSELQVTSFKDQIDWRTGQENELQSKLRALLESTEYPMLKMAQNYRSTSKSPSAKNTVKRSMEDSSNALEKMLGTANMAELEMPSPEDVFSPLNIAEIEERSITLPFDGNPTLKFRVVIEEGDSKLFRMEFADSEGYIFTINRAHPFMNSFANLPGADLDPIFRMSLALGFAELLGKNAGLDHPAYIRAKINRILSDALSKKSE